jgi:hypothetical protein
MIESDPGQPPREEVQRQRAEGRYALVVESVPADEKAWRALRRALRLSRADDAWLRARVPGEVRRGAEVDLVDVLERVRAAGGRASLVERTGS